MEVIVQRTPEEMSRAAAAHPQRRFQGAAEEAAVVVGGDDDADARVHDNAASGVRVKGLATREMQKRYLPDASCGMRSTYSQS